MRGEALSSIGFSAMVSPMLTRWFAWDAAGKALPPSSSIVVGSAPTAPEDIAFVHEHIGATALLSLQSDDDLGARGLSWSTLWAMHARAGLRAERVPIRDFDGKDLARNIDGAVATAEALLSRGGRLYLHCSAGLNRSPTIAVAVRARVLGTLEAALSELAAVHPEAVVAEDALRKWARNAL